MVLAQIANNEPRDHHARLLWSMWMHTWAFSLVVGMGVFGYGLLFRGGFDDWGIVGETFAGTAAILIGLSFALSGFCYYFNFLDPKLFYRKFLGLVGFWYACGYVLYLVAAFPERYVQGWKETLYQPEAQLGVAAMVILSFMAVISNQRAMHWLGCARWRQALRTGYLAYALLIIRALLVEGEGWVQWVSHPRWLPPPRLLVTLFAIFVLALRCSMIILELPWMKRLLAEEGTRRERDKVC